MSTLAHAPLSVEAISERYRYLIQDIAETPLELNKRLSHKYQATIYMKREDMQIVRSYKIRGALNKISQLTEAEKKSGVIAASAGNHAQGVAFACKSHEILGRIYVPVNTPMQKQERIIHHGGEWITLIRHGHTYDEAAEAAAADTSASGATLVHGFDDIDIIQGQATIGLEIVEQCKNLGIIPDLLIVPVGGGGCISGITSLILQVFPQTRIIGVEPEGAESLTAAVKSHGPYGLENIDPFVDGAAVKKIGQEPWKILSQYGVHCLQQDASTGKYALPAPGTIGVISVPTGALCSTILDLYQNDGIIAEPAGALATTAVQFLSDIADLNIVTLISGGNNDISRYGEIMERSLVYEGLKHYFLVNFAQKPGSLRSFLDHVLGPNDDITLFEYVKRNNRETGAALVGLQLNNPTDFGPLITRLQEFPLQVEILEPGTAAYDYLT